MPGKVFISCGQREGREKEIANRVAKLLGNDFNLTPYLAFEIQSLDDIMAITKQLSSSDYFIFIDFLRDIKNSKQDLPISLFTHQELALAHHLGFGENIIALRERGVPEREGFIWYVQSNPEFFGRNNDDELIEILKRKIKDKCWTSEFSRHLVINNPKLTDPFFYTDHTGRYYQRVWEVRVDNRRSDIAAVDTVCILDKIENNGELIEPHDRTYLKWSGQKGYRQTILSNDYGKLAIFAINAEKPGIFLNSLQDITPRRAIIDADGDYKLGYKLFSQGLPLVEFQVKVKYRWVPPSKIKWPLKTTAMIVW